jgi:hypothetical protein
MPATPKVVRPLRASKVVRLGAGLASFGFHFQPQLYRPAAQISLRRLAIFLKGSLSVFALRRPQKWFGLEPSAIVSTLFAFSPSSTRWRYYRARLNGRWAAEHSRRNRLVVADNEGAGSGPRLSGIASAPGALFLMAMVNFAQSRG